MVMKLSLSFKINLVALHTEHTNNSLMITQSWFINGQTSLLKLLNGVIFQGQ